MDPGQSAGSPGTLNVNGGRARNMDNVIAYPLQQETMKIWEKTRDEGVLKKTALRVRRHVVEMTGAAGSGHPGGSLSNTDLLVALYYGEMNHAPDEPTWPDRDRFVLSKGHACVSLYAILAMTGYYGPGGEDELITLRKLGSPFQGHPCMIKTPGIEMSTGSLGQGLSAAIGMALAGRISGKGYRVYAMLGDGELQEGQVWEAAMSAAHYKLDNLVGIVDYNGLQIDGKVSKVMGVAPLNNKWEAFGWHVIEINGHNFSDILGAFDKARGVRNQPTMIIANTIKGKGVSYMEYNVDFHGIAPNRKQVEIARQEFDAAQQELDAQYQEK